jgi:hypothetical protein
MGKTREKHKQKRERIPRKWIGSLFDESQRDFRKEKEKQNRPQ